MRAGAVILKNQKRGETHRALNCKIKLCPFNCFKASRANVAVYGFTFRHVRNLLYVGFKSSSRSSFRMAYVVTRGLTFAAHAAYS